MKKYIQVFLFILILFVNSCKREEFSNEFNGLFGKWKWSYSTKNTIDSVSDNNVYSLEISAKKVICFKNNKKVLRRTFKQIGTPETEYNGGKLTYGFFLTTNKNESILLRYTPDNSSIDFGGFPFAYEITNVFSSKTNYDYYRNYYTKN